MLKRVAVRVGLSSALAAGLLAAAQLPAYAGTILCSGSYLCIQTVSANSRTADVNAWANTKSFFGYFYYHANFGGGLGEGWDSPNEEWPAGGKHYTFVVTCSTSAGYQIQAIDYYTGGVLGSKNFTINSC